MTRETYFQWPYSIEYAVANLPATLTTRNLLPYSEVFEDDVWDSYRATVTADAIAGPFEGTLAATLTEDATEGSSHHLNRIKLAALTAGAVYTFSVYAKFVTRAYIALGAYDGTTTRYAYFNLFSKTKGSKHPWITSSAIETVGAWCRCSITYTAASTAQVNDICLASDDGSTIDFDGDSTERDPGVGLYGAQIEPGALTAYVLTPALYDTYPSTPITVAYRPGMRLDFRDLRARDPATLEANDLFCEDYVSGVSAEVALALHPGQTRVEILYGNGAAESVSDGEAVYPDFFDPFDGSSLDGAAWTVTGGAPVTVSGGLLSIAGANSNAQSVSSAASFGVGYAVRIRAAFGDTVGSSCYGWHAAASGVETEGATAYNTNGYRFTTYKTAYDADGQNPDTAWHLDDIARIGASSVVFRRDGAVAATKTTQLPTGLLPVGALQYAAGSSLRIDWVAVRPCSAVEPTLSYARMGINPWAFLADRSAVLAALGAGPGITTTDINDEDIISYTVRRSSSDVMYSADVTIHDLIPQGTNFTRVKLIEPDHNGVDRLIFFGFLPAQTSTIQAAKNSTNYKGWDYGYFIAGRDPGMSFCTMPSSTASPGAYLKAIFDASGQWPDLADPSRNLFDTSHIDVDAPAAWNTAALPARDIVVPTSSKLMALCQKIATDTGTIFYVKWDDIGTTPAIGHSDPAYQIVRKEAEDYDEGGYYDTTAANLGGAYRKDGVDIEYFASEAGYNVGWIRDGEWMQYTVNFPAVDTYVARFRTASAAATGARSFKVYIDGALVDTISVDGTGSYSAFAWNTDTCDIVIGTAGDHVIKLLFDNAGDDVADLLHMNIASMEFTPTPTISGTVPSTIVPAIYYCDEADIDTALALEVIAIDPFDPTLAGAVKYVEDSADLANSVIVRYRQPSAPDTLLETGNPWIFTGDGTYNGLELPIDHVETVETPITTATAEALRDALKAYYASNWGTVTANFTRRPDLQLFQRLWFRGHAQIPEYEADGTTPVLFRIVDISYSVGLARCDVSITAVPARKFSIERQIARTRAPDPATEMEAVARAVIKSLPPALTGTAGSVVGTGSVAVALDRGGTITARGVAANGSRVICTWAEGIGYVASVIAPAV